ncbi:MAG: hypothetical protein ACI4N4_02410 [Candidatus Fimenecus sp.]
MEISKIRYKALEKPHKVYLDMTTLEIREKLNIAFLNPVSKDDMTGILGKYLKTDKLYRIKYIYTRNKQLQPQTFDRYYYLLDVDEDENGAFIEYMLVYDKLFEPLVRTAYILAALTVAAYLAYMGYKNAMSRFSAGVLIIIVLSTVGVIFKKSKETAEECKKAERIIEKIISDL